MIVTFVVVFRDEHQGILLLYPTALHSPHFTEVYIKTHTRATPYFIGCIAGYFYYKRGGQQKQLGVVSNIAYVISRNEFCSG